MPLPDKQQFEFPTVSRNLQKKYRPEKRDVLIGEITKPNRTRNSIMDESLWWSFLFYPSKFATEETKKTSLLFRIELTKSYLDFDRTLWYCVANTLVTILM